MVADLSLLFPAHWQIDHIWTVKRLASFGVFAAMHLGAKWIKQIEEKISHRTNGRDGSLESLVQTQMWTQSYSEDPAKSYASAHRARVPWWLATHSRHGKGSLFSSLRT